MAKRGRKPKENKGYFYDEEENAIVQYIKSNDEAEKNKIFNEILYPALTKMIESIIRRYKLFVPDEEFEQNFSDTISYLLTKINHYDPEKGHKAYSYCGTVCKHYLMLKCSLYAKKKMRNTPYDDVFEELSNNEDYSTNDVSNEDIAEKMVEKIANEIETMTSNPDKSNLTEDEIKVGEALINLFRNWEEILPDDGSSNKLQKSSILYYLREETMMSTKEVRDNMKKFKSVYYILKKDEIEDQ